MGEAAAFTYELTALSLMAAAAEFLMPKGKLKGTASFAVGLVFTSAVLQRILGIIARMGV